MFGYLYDLGRPRFSLLERTPWRDSNAVRGVAIGGVDVSEVKGVFCFCGIENPSMVSWLHTENCNILCWQNVGKNHKRFSPYLVNRFKWRSSRHCARLIVDYNS